MVSYIKESRVASLVMLLFSQRMTEEGNRVLRSNHYEKSACRDASVNWKLLKGLELAGNVVERLEGKEDRRIGRRKAEVSVDGDHEETAGGALRAAARAEEAMEVLEGTEWMEMVAMLEARFLERRNAFLETLEKQPGFLQSSFLALHRKLRLRFRCVVCL